jgi:CDP-diglyceride synthetase
LDIFDFLKNEKMKTEKILAILFIISILFKLLYWPGGSILMILALLPLALIYFPLGFYFINEKNVFKKELLKSIFFGWLLSTIPIGVLFKCMHWQGASFMLIIGSITGFFLLIYSFILKQNSEENSLVFHNKLFLRTLILFGLSFLLYLIPTQQIIRINYLDDPKLGELYIRQYENLQDENIKMEIEEYIHNKNTK